MFDFCKKAYIRCLEEIKLRNIGGMILIDFPRMSSTKKKLLHEKIVEIGKKYFTDGKFLGFLSVRMSSLKESKSECSQSDHPHITILSQPSYQPSKLSVI